MQPLLTLLPIRDSEPQAYEGGVFTLQEVPEDEPVLDGACGVCDETMVLALGLCFRCRGESASSSWKSEGAMTMRTPKWSWHAVAIPPLEMHRRMERRIAGGIVNGSEAAWSKDDDSGRILLAECPALRRHQDLRRRRQGLGLEGRLRHVPAGARKSRTR